MLWLIKIIQFKFWLIFFLPGKLPLYIMGLSARLIAFIVKRTSIARMVQKNMALILPPEKATQQNANQLITNTAYALFEIICLPYFRAEHFSAVNEIIGAENLAKARAAGKGALLLTMHAGNYEITPSVISRLGYPINSILKANEPIFDPLNRARVVGGGKLINVLEKDMFTESLKVMKKNEFAGILIDTGALESRYEKRQFLGKEVPMASGWLTLAQRAGCAIVPVTSRKKNGKNLITFHDLLFISPTNRDETVKKVIGIYESFILNNPDQWAIFFNSYETKRMVEGG
ncbi:MAG: hypothetical protein WC890_00130 [Candidatus Margulisiibacteriota bacterium]